MKPLNVLLGILILVACQKESGFLPLATPDRLLTSIEYITNNQRWSVDYFYDIDDRLIRVDDLRGNGRKYELSYEQERLSEVKTYNISEDQLIFRDELEYDVQGQVYKTYYYSSNGEGILPLASIQEYKYNTDGILSEKLTFNPEEDTPISIEKYLWDKGNIIKVAYHDGTEDLRYEFTYEYDQSYNYNRYQTNMVNQFYTLNQNNIIYSELTRDRTGLIDLSCNPCTSDFFYDKNNYPIEVESTYQTFKLFYK